MPVARILVLEDHLPRRLGIVALLRRAGYEVDATASPHEALALMVAAERAPEHGGAFDLLLVDQELRMPGTDLPLGPDAPAPGTGSLMAGTDFIRAVTRLATSAAIPDSVRLSHAPVAVGISSAADYNRALVRAGAVTSMLKSDYPRRLLPLVADVLRDAGYELPEGIEDGAPGG